MKGKLNAIHSSWLPVRMNSRDHDHAVSGRSNAKIQESEVKVQGTGLNAVACLRFEAASIAPLEAIGWRLEEAIPFKATLLLEV